MSLTSFLAEPQHRAALKELLPKPTIQLAEECTANVPSRGTSPQLIGTAFDYLIRFDLHKSNPGARVSPVWVAHHAVAKLRGPLGTLPDFAPYVDSAHQALARAESIVENHVRGEDVGDDLLQCALDLARLDVIFRARYPPAGLGEYPVEAVDELNDLRGVAATRLTRQANDVWLNPAFDAWSVAIGGADADLVLDGCLVDVKTVKEPKAKVDDWLQIIGYAVLAELCHDSGIDAPRIDHVGLYFSRYGALWTYPLSELHDSGAFKAAKKYYWETLGGPLVGG